VSFISVGCGWLLHVVTGKQELTEAQGEIACVSLFDWIPGQQGNGCINLGGLFCPLSLGSSQVRKRDARDSLILREKQSYIIYTLLKDKCRAKSEKTRKSNFAIFVCLG